MTKKKWWLISAVTATLIAGLLTASLRDTSAPSRAASASDAHGGLSSWFSRITPTAGEPSAHAASGASAQPSATRPASPLDSMILPTFRATPQGRLATDQQTRLDIERIYALFPRDEARAKLDSQASSLPDQAQRELHNLFQQYTQYAQAVTQTFPPEQNTGALDDAERQFSGLKALRRQYFGDDMAQTLFGEEEKTAQELLDLMRKQADPKLSMEEKAEQAQAEWKKRQTLSGQP